jgi:transposase-like protein
LAFVFSHLANIPQKTIEEMPMRHHDFLRFLDRISYLSPAQIAVAGTAFQDVRRRTEALTKIEARAEQEHKCPFCDCEARQKWGTTKTNVQRYRCSGCLKTYSGRTTWIIRYLNDTQYVRFWLRHAHALLLLPAPSFSREHHLPSRQFSNVGVSLLPESETPTSVVVRLNALV